LNIPLHASSHVLQTISRLCCFSELENPHRIPKYPPRAPPGPPLQRCAHLVRVQGDCLDHGPLHKLPLAPLLPATSRFIIGVRKPLIERLDIQSEPTCTSAIVPDVPDLDGAILAARVHPAVRVTKPEARHVARVPAERHLLYFYTS
jgi:hypothetical protein